MTRNRFYYQLEQLNHELIKMGTLCEYAISNAALALLENDESLPQKVFEAEAKIDRMERDIETMCMKLLLHQQPVATDLRCVSSALKMISDMERIGDQAADIAEISQYLKNNYSTSKVHIKEMAKETIKMVTDSIESYVNKDLELAEAVIVADDKVDELFKRVKGEIIELIAEDKGKNGEFCLDLLMVAKYLERIGDHATNIAEWVKYYITGSHFTENVVEF